MEAGPKNLPRAWLIATTLAVVAASHDGQLSAARRQEARDEVTFQWTRRINRANRAVFVVGDLPELGSGETPRSVQLVSPDRVNWAVTVSLPADRAYSYQFLERITDPTFLGSPANGTVLSPLLTGFTRKTPLGPGSKALQMHTTLQRPLLHWRQDGGEFQSGPLKNLGPGRTKREGRYGLESIGLGRRPIEFFLTSADGAERDPRDENSTYSTPLDELFLQDGELFSYEPAPFVGPARMASAEPFTLASLVLGEERRYRVMLPRGYDEHPQRRYPVLYLYDGQFMWTRHPFFDPSLGVWDEGGNHMAEVVRNGRVGETIVVAIEFVETPDVCDLAISRGRDCLEETIGDLPGDPVLCGFVTGRADLFLRFIVEELKPRIDATYRTRPEREHTFASGYSYGGLFAMYAGWEHGETFGAVASQSGSFWVPSFTQRLLSEPRRAGLRIYLDYGTGEPDLITRTTPVLMDSLLLRDPGYVVEGDLRFVLGFGQTHTFLAGGSRMESLMTFLWPATSEASETNLTVGEARR